MLEIAGLDIAFPAGLAVRGASLRVPEGARIGIVGESGSGKSMLAAAMLGMAPETARLAGEVRVDGSAMGGATERDWRRLRGRRVAMIFQDPMSALNPLRRLDATLSEPLRLHLGLSASAAQARALELLAEVGIPDPAARLKQYPHELSGGQRQRVLIALALSCNPALLIADEPTTALDVQVGRQVLDLLLTLAQRRRMAIVLISHDLGAVAHATEELLVMYGGDIVERGPTADVLAAPAHPYTRGLLAARPRLDPTRPRRQRLPSIAGTVPPLGELPPGCRFAGRCPVELPQCRTVRPATIELAPDRSAACHLLSGATT